MGIYDILVAGLVLGTTFLGWRKGLATQVAAIVSIIASFAVAVRYRELVAEHIDAAEPWNKFAAMLILYLGTSLIIWLIFRQIRSTIERLRLGEFDRQMGALFGAIKGIALASVVTLFAFTLLQESQRQAIIHSKSGVWIAKLIHSSTPIMPPEVLQFINPYLEALNQGFGDGELGEMRFAFPTSPRLPTEWPRWPSSNPTSTPAWPPEANIPPYSTSPYPATSPMTYEYRPVTPRP